MSLFLSMLTIAASIGFVSAIIGCCYVLILTEPGQILAGWKEFVNKAYDKLFKKYSPSWYRNKWVLKPILECELCVSGQIALWTYIITQPFNILGLIFSICLSIMLAWLIARVMNNLTSK